MWENNRLLKKSMGFKQNKSFGHKFTQYLFPFNKINKFLEVRQFLTQ